MVGETRSTWINNVCKGMQICLRFCLDISPHRHLGNLLFLFLKDHLSNLQLIVLLLYLQLEFINQ